MAEQFSPTGRVRIVVPDGLPHNAQITLNGATLPHVQRAQITIEPDEVVRAELTIALVPVDLLIEDGNCTIDMSAAVRFEVERRYERTIGHLFAKLHNEVIGGKPESDEVLVALRQVFALLHDEFTHNVPKRGHVGEEMAALRQKLTVSEAENATLRARVDASEGRAPTDG